MPTEQPGQLAVELVQPFVGSGSLWRCQVRPEQFEQLADHGPHPIIDGPIQAENAVGHDGRAGDEHHRGQDDSYRLERGEVAQGAAGLVAADVDVEPAVERAGPLAPQMPLADEPRRVPGLLQ